MARQLLVLALVFFAVVGLAAAAAKAPAPSDDTNIIGTTDGSSDAAPVGGPVAAGVFPSTPAIPSQASAPAPSPKSGSSALEVSAVAASIAVASVAAAVFF